MGAAGTLFSQHPQQVIAAVVAPMLAIWGVSLYSITSQIGLPFPGFLYTPDRHVSSLTPEDFGGPQAGVRPHDYIMAVKDADPETMLRAVRAIAQGESLLSPTVAQKVLRQFAALPGEAPAGHSPLWDDLTEREQEGLGLIGQGHKNREIASQLCISQKMVKNHIGNIFAKLHVYDRTRAVSYAIRKGLVKAWS